MAAYCVNNPSAGDFSLSDAMRRQFDCVLVVSPYFLLLCVKALFMKRNPSPLECRDTGLALAFLALLLWWMSPAPHFIYAAMIVLLATMIWPGSMRRPAMLWFGLSHLLGTVMNKVILGLLFFLVVLPIALLRKALGKDAMRFRQWKNGEPSTFIIREHVFAREDLDDTF